MSQGQTTGGCGKLRALSRVALGDICQARFLGPILFPNVRATDMGQPLWENSALIGFRILVLSNLSPYTRNAGSLQKICLHRRLQPVY
jgi:hypothetical protein